MVRVCLPCHLGTIPLIVLGPVRVQVSTVTATVSSNKTVPKCKFQKVEKEVLSNSRCVCYWSKCSSHSPIFKYNPLCLLVLYYGWLQSISMLIMETTLCCGPLHIHQHLSLHTMVVKPPINLIFVSLHFNLITFPKLLGISFQLGLIIPQQYIISNCK